MRTLLVITIAALATAVPAAAGGYATVGVSPLPSGDSATWTPTLTVKAHGVTPVDGAAPVVTVRNRETGETRTFEARHAGKPGTYRVTVVFPGAGTWEYTVADGYAGQVHTFPPVEIASGAALAGGGGGGGSVPWALVALAGAAVAAAAATLTLVLRRRGRPAAPAPAAR